MSGESIENIHAPVLLGEVEGIFENLTAGIFVDATIGLGGHANAILESRDDLKLIGIDQDLEAIEHSRQRLAKFGDRVRIFHSNFTEIRDVLRMSGETEAVGIFADLGVSSLQFDSPERGFSFRYDAPLDMRMNPEEGIPTAAELLERLTQKEIADLIYIFGEERFSRRIASAIVARREIGQPITTTRGLAELIERRVPRKRKETIHPATKTFQALRIVVNNELGSLEKFIGDAVDILSENGKLAVISFHSLEDRIVKNAFLKLSGKCFCPPRIPMCMCGAKKTVEILTRKPTVPSHEEIQKNPRSRSAKLRVLRKSIPNTAVRY